MPSTAFPMGESTARRRVPAWVMSLVLHGLGLIAIRIIAIPATLIEEAESARPVGIVLASAPSENPVRYFQSSNAADSSAASASAMAALSGEERGEASTIDALPEKIEASELSMPDIQLPGSQDLTGSTEGLNAQAFSKGGTGRPQILPGQGDEQILAEEAAMRTAKAAMGPTTEVSLFGSPGAPGRSFVFAIDRSNSMGGTGLNALVAVRDELAKAIARLSHRHSFQIIAYHHTCVYYNSARLIPATDENKANVASFVDRLAAHGGTGHDMAVRAALGLEPDVVYLLTDGGDPHLNEIQLKVIHKLAEKMATIHCIEFGFGPQKASDNFLMRLARQNGGGYSYVDMSSASRKAAN